jgi:uncharacterized membrane protein YgaE (UPF0421/DUF939 family)
VQFRLALRVTTAAVAALVAARLLHLHVPLWAVLTAVVLTQLSVGRSVRATTDYFIGTIGAAVYAGIVGLLLPPTAEGMTLYAGLAMAVAPPTLLAALNPRLSAAPFTAVLVFLAPTITKATPIASALERLWEVAVGGCIGLIVSLLVLPARAHDLAIAAAADMLKLMARHQPSLFKKLTRHPRLDEAALLRQQHDIGRALIKLETTADEARHERMTRLTADADQGPLVRTMLRLRHDLVMIWRAALEPLPAPVEARLGPWLTRIGRLTGYYLKACARALIARRGPPPMDAVLAALDGFDGEMAALRQAGLTRELSAHDAEHVFALGFALDQLRQHFTDLARCLTELSASARRRTWL